MTQVEFPNGWERIETANRKTTRRYEVELSKAIDDLEAEMGRLGVDDWRLTTALDHQSQNPNRPYANQPEPDDPAVLVEWSMGGDQYAVACDRFTRARDNLRTVGLYIREKRKMENRPVKTGESEFANARLPPGDAEADVVVAGNGSTAAPHEVLGVDPDAPDAVVRGAARSLKADKHPDAGGSAEEFQRVVKAEGAMLDE